MREKFSTTNIYTLKKQVYEEMITHLNSREEIELSPYLNLLEIKTGMSRKSLIHMLETLSTQNLIRNLDLDNMKVSKNE